MKNSGTGGINLADKRWISHTNRRLRQKLYERDADFRGFHSHSYHKYFEDYTEYRRMGANGRMKLVREYTGVWYRQKLSLCPYLLIRILYVLLSADMVFMLIQAGCRLAPTAWYLTISEFMTVLVLTALSYILLINYVFAPRAMTVGQYKSASVSLGRISLAAAGCFAADTLFVLLSFFLSQTGSGKGTVMAAAQFLACVLSALAMSVIERRVPYEVCAAAEPPGDDGVQITVD